MTKLDELQSINSLSGLAKLLGFKPSALSHILYNVPATTKYHTFVIFKKNGSARNISAPYPQPKLLQRRLNKLLQACLVDAKSLDKKRGRAAHGFVEGRSIYTNARPHVGKRYIVNIDLEDFFPSINFGRVRGVLMKDKHFAIKPNVATIIAQIACHDNSLPQGGPSSPVVSTLVASILDVYLSSFANKHRLCYTRYADDLTFSTNEQKMPTELGRIDAAGNFAVGRQLFDLVVKAGFVINSSKTKIHIRTSQQHVTGLIVNSKVNVSQMYWRKTRAMCDSLYKGRAPYANPSFSCASSGGAISEASIEGRLGHIYWVRKLSDARSEEDKKRGQLGITKEYRRFLFRKHFVKTEAPLILCEGKTDSVYLKAALRSPTTSHPALVSKKVLKVKFFKYSKAASDILELSGGSSFIAELIKEYKVFYNKFHGIPAAFPVILLIDNDDGAKGIFGICGKKKHVTLKPSRTSTDLFYYLGDNLYLVKTVENGAISTKIEDCFPGKWLKVTLGKSVFNPDKKHDSPGEYGKHIFSQEIVVKNATKIDFAGFSPLLARIEAAIQDYNARKSSSSFL